MGNVNFEFIPKENTTWQCYMCGKDVDIKNEWYPKFMHLSVGVKDLNESQVEIQYLEAECKIPRCYNCSKKESKHNKLSFYTHFMFSLICLVYPYFVLSDDLNLIQIIFWWVCISIGSLMFGNLLLHFIIKKPLRHLVGRSDVDEGEYPLINQLMNMMWCERTPDSQISPAMHLAVPYDGDYNKYNEQLVMALKELAESNNYELIVNNLNYKTCTCSKN